MAAASLRPRVLICEDAPDIARLIAMMLDKGGLCRDDGGPQAARCGQQPVVVFSASEVDPPQSARVAAVLLKAQTSDDELLQTLQRVLGQTRPS